MAAHGGGAVFGGWLEWGDVWLLKDEQKGLSHSFETDFSTLVAESRQWPPCLDEAGRGNATVLNEREPT